jgi:hypothetical protein
MLNSVLAGFYERDLRRMIVEVNSFTNEEDLWRTQGSVKNSAGNLVLHIIGGLNHFIGATLAHTNYVRNLLHLLGLWVMYIAQNQESVLSLSGFDLAKSTTTPQAGWSRQRNAKPRP